MGLGLKLCLIKTPPSPSSWIKQPNHQWWHSFPFCLLISCDSDRQTFDVPFCSSFCPIVCSSDHLVTVLPVWLSFHPFTFYCILSFWLSLCPFSFHSVLFWLPLSHFPSRGRIFKTMYGARNREELGLLYRPARLNRFAESIPWIYSLAP